VSPPLPLTLRLISIGTTVLAALVVFASWFSLMEAFSSIDASGINQAVEQQEPIFSKLYKEESQAFALALTSSLEARQSGLNDMRNLRILTLLGLSICATSLFMSGWRLLMMEPFSRPRIARTLSKTALACAIFRTLDGAQSAALARRSGAAFDFSAAFKAHFPQGMETTLLVFSVTFTFSIVVFFLWVWRYFQAPKTLALLETPPPS